MKAILPIILIASSIAVFVMFTNKTYVEIKEVKSEIADYNIAFGKSREVLRKRGVLAEEYKRFSQTDLEAVKKILPDQVDNIQLVLDMDGIARSKGMELKNIKIDEEKISKDAALGPQKNPYGSISVSFKTSGTYANFGAFLEKLEQSLRIVDVTALSFKSTETGIYDYSVTLKTYWLK